jgi:hypothetical protein
MENKVFTEDLKTRVYTQKDKSKIRYNHDYTLVNSTNDGAVVSIVCHDHQEIFNQKLRSYKYDGYVNCTQCLENKLRSKP